MSDNDQEKTEGKGFTVTDKRFSHQSASEKKETLKEHAADIKHEESVPPPKQEEGEKTQQQPQEEVTFNGLIFSLSHSVMVQLGEIPDPTTNEKQKNLPLAKQSIDLIALLQEKTKGNLSQEEEGLLQNILYDLRMRFVQNSS